jgi:uncharacterized membrane protein YedE/YeeE
MTIVLAAMAGLGLGYIIERGDFCFHSTLRGLFQGPRQLDLFRAYLLAVLVGTPIVYALIGLGLIGPWIPPFAWQANLTGGLVFGIGMVVAATCVTGLFYKLGHGMLGALVGLAAWAVGDIVTYIGPLAPLRETLNSHQIAAENGQSATLLNLLGPAVGLALVALLGLSIGVWLWRSPRPFSDGAYWNWARLGLTVGLFTGLVWLLAQAGGSDYTYGTSSVPTRVWLTLTGGSRDWSPWITVSLICLIPGAFLAARLSRTLWVRGELPWRYVQLAAGGLLMGIGAAIAGGCNLGHGLVGVPLLSMGSIVTVVSMAIGVWLADRAIKLWTTTRSKPLLAEGTG